MSGTCASRLSLVPDMFHRCLGASRACPTVPNRPRPHENCFSRKFEYAVTVYCDVHVSDCMQIRCRKKSGAKNDFFQTLTGSPESGFENWEKGRYPLIPPERALSLSQIDFCAIITIFIMFQALEAVLVVLAPLCIIAPPQASMSELGKLVDIF